MPSITIRSIRRRRRTFACLATTAVIGTAVVAPIAAACAPRGQATTVCNTGTGLWDATYVLKGDANPKYSNELLLVVSQSRPTTPMLVGQSVKGESSISATESGLPAGTTKLDLMVKRVSTGQIIPMTLTAESTGTCIVPPTPPEPKPEPKPTPTPPEPKPEPKPTPTPTPVPPKVVVPVAPQLSLDKHRLGPKKRHGNTVSFTITVKNTGLVTAKHIKVKDLVPGGFYILRGKVVTNIAQLAPGQSKTISVTLRSPSKNPRGCFKNRAKVTYNSDGTVSFVTTTATSEAFCFITTTTTAQPNNPAVAG